MSALTLNEIAAHASQAAQDDESAQVAQARREGKAFIATHGFPGRKHEDWRYVRLAELYDSAFVPAETGQSALARDNAAIGSLLSPIPDLGGARIVFIDGQFAPHWSERLDTPGLTVTDVATSMPTASDVASDLFAAAPLHTFDALNATLATTGAHIVVDAECHVGATVHCIHILSGAGAPVLANLRNIVHIADGARLRVVVSAIGAPEAKGMLNTTTRVHLGRGAQLTYRDIQDQPTNAFHLSLLEVTQQAESSLNGHVSSIGGAVARHEIHVRQVGDDAFTQLDGLFIPRGDQQHDHPILIEHCASGGVSRQTYRGVVDGRGHGVFNGRIIVHPGAQRIDADQSNKNLLLSKTAGVDTRPRLEIYADDVKATHGASVGRLDDDQLFYLRSRGIPEAEARRVLTFAFIAQIVERLGGGPLHDRITSLVAERLHPDGEQKEVPA